ncbi:hypothetical protein TRSC58_07611 [Trypanosoma rangeli SC58]|uniref:Uncharacterized protein n=1 Tax=Trypanosoma rangeli SC58 TaxID=429131 RepID=A0A061IRJ4_TRYRA|nr:hypothetical protein TRSC58_07611 [Trypanosoma rangeli SC58]
MGCSTKSLCFPTSLFWTCFRLHSAAWWGVGWGERFAIPSFLLRLTKEVSRLRPDMWKLHLPLCAFFFFFF